jgi:hypothetical protein
MKQKLTPWFPPNMKPVRPGLYIASIGRRNRFYRRWTGKRWLYGSYSQEDAATMPARPWPEKDYPLHWRGLASDPKAKA